MPTAFLLIALIASTCAQSLRESISDLNNLNARTARIEIEKAIRDCRPDAGSLSGKPIVERSLNPLSNPLLE